MQNVPTILITRFNPCFDGSVARGVAIVQGFSPRHLVSILVLMEV